ncbi:MAG: hypothetical protein NZ841_08385 [Dictyoglomus sp.]|nr:hypothetical protein [Dictyoglomus sp.]MDW8189300.1 hypothetical protein [Dictyoglomus sp.]
MKQLRNVGLNRYNSIGLKDRWLKVFTRDTDLWFKKNNLGKAQYKSMLLWLRDSELIEKNKSSYLISGLTKLLFHKDIDSELFWEIIWINLFYNSKLVASYLKNFDWGKVLNKQEIINIIKYNYPQLSEITIKNAYNSLLNTFENTPLGKTLKIGVIEKVGRMRIVKKIGTNDIHPIAVLYSLYRYAISKNRYRLTVSEFYREDNKEGGPYLLFGISRDALENILRYLSDKFRKYIYVEIIADLDNISLLESTKDYVELLKRLIWKQKKL